MSAPLLIEIACEELPAGLIAPALDALEQGVLKLLKGVSCGAVRRYSTPRRLCVVVEDVADARPIEVTLVTGPPAAAAKRDGEWTRAAQGFARGKGVGVDDLEIVEGPRGPVIAARQEIGGERAVDLVAAGLERLVIGLPFKKSMHWGARVGDTTVRWGRPVRGVVATYGGEALPCDVLGRPVGAEVRGHRLSGLGPAAVIDAEGYVDALRARHVLADRGERAAALREGLGAAAAELGVGLRIDERLFEEVVDLVEWPVIVAARFDAELLALPARLLEESMRVHQRYFPTWEDDGLSNTFLIASNNPWGDAGVIAEGNARVIGARFHDAKFFFAEDLKRPLDQHGADLQKMRWVRGLGTVADKQARLAALGPLLAERLGGSPEQVAAAARVGALTKCDLLTSMVGEFPELQGHMGRLYAERADEPEAMAIEEHYLPRSSGDDLPGTLVGTALALADRLDTLVACFAAGMKPKGSADPQGLRRAAIGVNAILMAHGGALDLYELTELAWGAQTDPEWKLKLDLAHTSAEVVDFLQARLRVALQSEGFATDVVDAVMAVGAGADPVEIRGRAQALSALSASGDFADLMIAFKRVLNISKDHSSDDFDPAAFSEPSERSLGEAFAAARGGVAAAMAAREPGAALSAMVELKPTIDTFFDDVMVMADDPAVRDNRLGLLTAISTCFLGVADFRRISTEV